MSNFAENLRTIRTKRNLTQGDLAKALGVSRSTISMYESGNRAPEFDTVEQIARILHVEPQDLLGWTYKTKINGDAYQELHNKYTKYDQDQTSGQHLEYYLDTEVAQKAQEIYEDPDLRILLDAKRDLTKEDLDAVINIVKALKAKEGK